MAGQVDTNVVAMRFDNAQFEQGVSKTLKSVSNLKENLKFENSNKGLTTLANSLKNVSFDHLSNGVDTIANKFTTMGMIGVTALTNIVNKAVDAGTRIVSALTIDPVTTGFNEYELKMGSIQTMMASTGESLETVNGYLNELNTYSDKTIYSFSDMTQNIGKFTNAGVGLKDAVMAIQGISNEAAVSGANANEASRAMYNFAQALSAGAVKLIDWKSIENANMATVEFKEQLMETALSVGTLVKEGDKFKSTTKDAQGKVSDLFNATSMFNESLSSQWMTTEVLVETLKKYSDETTDIGKKAFASAQDIKTVSMLWDTLTEEAQSGWAMTWEILVGDFEEAKVLLTGVANAISPLISGMSNARNELLSSWKELGGRTALIDSFARGFQLITDVVKPIKEAMNEIFPPMTADRLMDITQKFADFMNSLSVSEEMASRIKNTFEGFFGIFKIGQLVIQELTGKATAFISPLKKIADVVSQFTSDVGSSIADEAKHLNLMSDQGVGPLESWAYRISYKLKELGIDVDDMKTSIPAKVQEMGESLGSAFGNLSERVNARIEPVKNVLTNLWTFIHDLIAKLAESAPSFEEIAGAFDTAFGAIREAISNAFSNVNFDNGIDLINTGMLASLVVMIKKFMDSLKDMKGGEGGPGILDKIKDTLDGVLDSLKAWQANLSAKTLLTIAGAVAILAGSLIALSLVDSEKLGSALMSITIMFVLLIGSMQEFAALSGEGLGALTKAAGSLVLLAAAIAILTFAVGNLAKLDIEDLIKGLAGLAVIFAEIIVFMKAADKFTSGLFDPKTGVGLVALAGAMVILSVAVEKLGKLSVKELAKGVGSLSVTMIAMAAAMKIMDAVQINARTSIAFIAMAGAIVILTAAVSNFANMDPEAMARGLFAMATAMLAVSGSMQLMSGLKNGAGIAVAVIGIATAMLILTQAVQQLGTIDPEALTRGLFGLATSLLMLTAATNAMPTNTPAIAAGLLIMSVALLGLAQALGTLGSMSGEDIGKSLTALGVSLGILAGAVFLFQKSIVGAAVMPVIAAALLMLAPALAMIGAIPAGNIITALLAIAGTFTVLGVAALALQPVTPTLFALAGAIALFGVAVLAAGVGVAAFAAGLLLLATAGAGAGAGLTALIAMLAGSIPLVFEKIGEGLVALIMALGKNTVAIVGVITDLIKAILQALTTLIPEVGALISTLITEILRVLTEAIPQFGQLISTIITELIRIVVEAVPQFIEAGLTIITSFLQGIASHIGGIVTAGADIVVNFLGGIGANIGRIIQAGIDLILDFINGMADGIRDNKDAIWDAMGNLITAIIEFFVTGIEDLLEVGGNIVSKIGEGIEAFASGIGDFCGGIIDGIGQAIMDSPLGQIGQGIGDLLFGGNDNGKKEAENVGENITKSMSSGIDDSASNVSGSAKTAVSDANSAADTLTGSFSTVGLHIAQGTAAGISDNAWRVNNAAAAMVSGANLAARNAGEIKSPSRLFMREVGKYIPMGVAAGIDKFSSYVEKASSNMISGAYDNVAKRLDSFSTVLNNIDLIEDTQPKITPILDLSEIQNGSTQLSQMLDKSKSYSMGTGAFGLNLNPVTFDRTIQNASRLPTFETKVGNRDVVNAIHDLGSKLDSLDNTGQSININGITYDDGTGIQTAVGELIDALTLGERM